MSLSKKTAASSGTRLLEDRIDPSLTRLLQAGLVNPSAIRFLPVEGGSRRFEACLGRLGGFEGCGEAPRGTV